MRYKDMTKGQPTVNVEFVREQAQLIRNAIATRQELMRQLMDPRRDLEAECGYPTTISVKDYRNMYDREGPGARVVDIWPDESWRVDPDIYEDEDEAVETEFELAVKQVGMALLGDSLHEPIKEGNPLFHYLHRVDQMSGIGHYGILLLGLDDGMNLNDPAKGIDEKGRRVGTPSQRRLLYLRVFDESQVQITKYVTDTTNPRYGMPESYNITFMDLETVSASSGVGLDNTMKAVHWSRVLHVADNCQSSEVWGVPRMRKNFNRLCDIRKIAGGSAEMFWKGAFPGYSFELQPDLVDVDIDTAAVRAEFERYSNGLQRYLALTGLQAKSLSPQVADPKGHLEQQLKLIAIAEGIPWRILAGSEEAKLASTQDKDSWNERVAYRQKTYLTPRLIVPFIDRLIALGVLPMPEKFRVEWPDLNTATEGEVIDNAVKRTQALSSYILGQCNQLMPPREYLTLVHGYDEETVDGIIESAVSSVEGDHGGDDPLAVKQENDAAEQAMQTEEMAAQQAEAGEVGHQRSLELEEKKGQFRGNGKPPFQKA